MEHASTRILLVEDNPADARLLQEALREEISFPFHLEKSEQLSGSLIRLAQGGIDLVLLDLFLPDSNGLETLTRIRKAFPQVPIVVLTGLNDQEIAVRSLKEGAQDFLPKDRLDGGLLVRAIRYALERNQLLMKINEKEERYSLAALGANDGLWDWDLKDNRIYFSARWKLILGFQESEIGGSPDEWFKRVHPEDLARVRQDISDHLAGKTSHFVNEHRLQHKDGSYRWVLSRGLAITDLNHEATRMAGSFTDITSHKNLEQSLALRAFYDPLTDLPNRRLFTENLEISFARFKRKSDRLFAVLFLDLDRLKFVNDSLGHLAGDQLLVEFSKRLKTCVRPNDLVARIGGDEFTVLLDDLKELGEATFIADRILESLKSPFNVGDKETVTTVSIGIAYSSCGKKTPDEIIQAADNAMYQAKSLGKARYEIFDETLQEDVAPKFLQLEADLRQAVHKSEFLNLYEPIVNLKTGQFVGAEVKLRWNHPRQGLLLPKDFVPLAEEIGFMGAINFLMLETACLQVKVWQALGQNDFFISVGFSSHQLQKDVVVRLIRTMLEKSGLKPGSLEVQVPGFLVLQETVSIPKTVLQLSQLGVRIALSHFNSGFSNLKEIEGSPIHNVKIDQELIQRIFQSPLEVSLAKMIVETCHGFNMKVTAEGVETSQQVEFLRKNQWDEIQGPVFSPPLTSDSFTKLLTDNKRLTA